ncbi:DUF6650 family protein [Pseudomonas sp. NBRC 111119]|uniref:DUF6650 family protein n=1 Tax=Pseudomonas sp. NBRC 111119 TaxID=1661034 RepID=UPI0012E0DCD3|nr:DUF6650 family protein [Pseudomonas sp. NBRC 111119]
MRKKITAAVSKLTGISTPFFGISWQPSNPEADTIIKLLMHFDSKRSLALDELGDSCHSKPVRPEWLSMSVIQIRDQTVSSMQTMSLSRPAEEIMSTIIRVCNDFLYWLESNENSEEHTMALSIWHRDMAICIFSLCRSVQFFPGQQLYRLLKRRLPSNAKLSDLERFKL